MFLFLFSLYFPLLLDTPRPQVRQVSELVFIASGEARGKENKRNSLRILLDFVFQNPKHLEEHRELLEGGKKE